MFFRLPFRVSGGFEDAARMNEGNSRPLDPFVGQTRGLQAHILMGAGSSLWRLSDLCGYRMASF